MSDGSSFLQDPIYTTGPDEAEQWRGGPSFSGDFYRDDENVVRGVSMAHGQVGALHEPFKGVDGDFYREPDDLLKGVTTGSMSAYMGGMDAGLGSDLYQGFSPDGFYEGFSDMKSLGKGCSYNYEDGIGGCQLPSVMDPKTKRAPSFKEGDVPPPKPVDEFFKLETTTLTVRSDRPFEIGNCLEDFLATKVTSSVSKVSTTKFSIKADVFGSSVYGCSGMCTLKVRVYGTDADVYAVEFQRRSGDCLTFNNSYQQAVVHLKGVFAQPSSFLQMQAVDAQLPQLRMPALSGCSLDQAEVAPLLDMASLTELPSVQAECATALSDLAQDFESAQNLCSMKAFDNIKKLLQTDQLDVAYPTSRLLLFLAQCPEAAPFFADGGLLPLMLEKVRSKSTGELVQHKLAQVLHATIGQCGRVLSEAAFQEVELALSEAIKEVDPDTAVRRNLAEASGNLMQIKSQRAGASAWR
mmetsp:Transcript_84565/g.217876  ORF Transcript_84565/g.217876 Transcript_84565/m.217876 type:complete len:466 (-) Transcript_84565:139-1536(-)